MSKIEETFLMNQELQHQGLNIPKPILIEEFCIKIKIILLRHLVKLDPNYKQAYPNRGTRYKRMNQFQDAIADYTKAIELDPNYEDVYYTRATYTHKKINRNCIKHKQQTIRSNTYIFVNKLLNTHQDNSLYLMQLRKLLIPMSLKRINLYNIGIRQLKLFQCCCYINQQDKPENESIKTYIIYTFITIDFSQQFERETRKLEYQVIIADTLKILKKPEECSLIQTNLFQSNRNAALKTNTKYLIDNINSVVQKQFILLCGIPIVGQAIENVFRFFDYGFGCYKDIKFQNTIQKIMSVINKKKLHNQKQKDKFKWLHSNLLKQFLVICFGFQLYNNEGNIKHQAAILFLELT